MLTARRVDTVRPVNGEFFVALLIGSTPEMLRQYRQELAKHGVLVRHAWPEARSDEVPGDVDVVLAAPVPSWQSTRLRMFLHRELARGRYVIDARNIGRVIESLKDGNRTAAPIALPWPESGGVRFHPISPSSPEPARSGDDGAPAQAPLAAVTPLRPPEHEEHKEPMPDSPISDDEKPQLIAMGKLLRERRFALGPDWSIGRVAKRIGRSRSYVYKSEIGAARTSDEVCDRFEALYGMTPGTLPRFGQRSAPKERSADRPKGTTTMTRTNVKRPPHKTRQLAGPGVTENREVVIAALMRIQGELTGLGLEDITILASYGDLAVSLSNDEFSLKRK